MTAANGVQPQSDHAPSEERRKLLNEELAVPLVSNFFPIEGYYTAAQKVFDSFQDAFEHRQIDNAFVYGKRYCLFVVDAIPQHNYFNATKIKKMQNQHHRQVDLVIDQLDVVATWMDESEMERQTREREEAKRRRQLAIQRAKAETVRYQQQEQERYRQLQLRFDQHKTHKESHNEDPEHVQASAMEKLEKLRALQNGVDVAARIPQDPSGEEAGKPGSRYRLLSDSEEDHAEQQQGDQRNPPYDTIISGTVLPPPLPLPSAPPSYDAIVTSRSSRNFLGPAVPSEPFPKSTFLNGNKFVDETTVALPATPETPARRQRVPMRELQHRYKQTYVKYQQAGKIKVSGINTYQGRLIESTNGCTVISALVAAHQLSSRSGAVTDATVINVIDRQCGPLLREIRGKLGLGGHALIIPSDVHDHLVDHNILSQETFVGAAGGNILDEGHMNEFLKLLQGDSAQHAKAAATLFFREHVISIVKSQHGKAISGSLSNQGLCCYELIDSMPGMFDGGRGMATRTRCTDMDSLQVLLRWYASRKFSDSNCSYIDKTIWDDSMADFDPRVFQGFVWAAAS
jgi:hypothetical protein